jgi:hypothetical protein
MAERPTGPLCEEDMVENYRFRLGDSEHGKDDPVELVDRVRRGVKPMATILLRCGMHIHLGVKALKHATEAMGLSCQIVNTRGARVEGVVYQKGLTLGHFYPSAETMARYKVANVHLTEDCFTASLETLARHLANEDFSPAQTKYPMMGMCFGYPVSSTLELLQYL